MKKKLILKIVMPLFMSTFLISCTDKAAQLSSHNVGLASGVGFNKLITLENNKFVVINPFKGKRLQPCGDTIIAEKNYSTTKSLYQSNPNCNNIIVEPSEDLTNALTLKKPIKGFILKDGKKQEAVFYVSVTALYLGSHCTSLFLAGAAYTNCVAQGEEAYF